MSEKRPDTNSQIEQILIQKAEKLPTPRREWTPEGEGVIVEFENQSKQSEGKMQKNLRGKKRVKWRRWVAFAAVITVLVGIGVSAKEAEKTYYGLWSGIQWSRSDTWAKEYLSKKYDVVLPKELGDYEFAYIEQMRNSGKLDKNEKFSWYYMIKNKIKSYLDVEYRSLWVSYEDGEKERSVGNITVQGTDDINLSVGSTTMEYWSTFYGFNPETREWNPESERFRESDKSWYEDLRTEEYKGITIYLATSCDNQTGEIMENHIEGVTRSQVAHWIDEEKQLCYALSGSRYSDEDIMLYVKQLIDAQEEK